MTDEKKPSDPKPVADDKVAPAHKITRRRFAKAGAVAPIVMTLVGRPVWGQSTANSSAGASVTGSPTTTALTVTQVSSSAAQWQLAAENGSWPRSTEFPGFTAASGDSFQSHFPLESSKFLRTCDKANAEVDRLARQSLASVLGGVIGVNEKLSMLAKQATAARLNALLAESLASKLVLTRELFPMRPQSIVDGFWDAVQIDCTGTSTASLTTTSVKVKSSEGASKTSCAGYDQGTTMASFAGQLDDLNSSGTSVL